MAPADRRTETDPLHWLTVPSPFNRIYGCCSSLCAIPPAKTAGPDRSSQPGYILSGPRHTGQSQVTTPVAKGSGGCHASQRAIPGRAGLHSLERCVIEKGKTRGGSTAPPGQTARERRVFCAKRQAVWLEVQCTANAKRLYEQQGWTAAQRPRPAPASGTPDRRRAAMEEAPPHEAPAAGAPRPHACHGRFIAFLRAGKGERCLYRSACHEHMPLKRRKGLADALFRTAGDAASPPDGTALPVYRLPKRVRPHDVVSCGRKKMVDPPGLEPGTDRL